MAHELIYTSSPKGLRTGSRGFCTVAATAGISPQAVVLMESLSGYRHVEPPVQTDARNPANPVLFSHLLTTNGTSLLSRVADAGLDYSGRNNKIAHHRLLDPSERSPAGPAAMIIANPFCERWEGDPRMLPVKPLALDVAAEQSIDESSIPADPTSTSNAHSNAQRLAATVPDQREAYVIFSPADDAIGLIHQAMSLLTPAQRWQTTFSTYFTALPPGMRCQWRFILDGSKEVRRIPPHDRVLKINLAD